MSILDRIGKSVRSATRDIVLIVVSILIAFVLNATWTGCNERAEEKRALASIKDEFQASGEALDNTITQNRALLEGITKVLSYDASGVVKANPDSLRAIFVDIMYGPVLFNPSMGALEALIGGGQLDRIQNFELKAAIAAWPGYLNEIGEDQDLMVRNWEETVGRLGDLGLLSTLASITNIMPSVRRVSDQDLFMSALSDSQFREILAIQGILIDGTLMEFEGVSEQIIRIVDLLADDVGA